MITEVNCQKHTIRWICIVENKGKIIQHMDWDGEKGDDFNAVVQ